MRPVTGAWLFVVGKQDGPTADVASDIVGTCNATFDRLYTSKQRIAGHRLVEVPEESLGVSETHSRNFGIARTKGRSIGHTNGTSLNFGRSDSMGANWTDTRGVNISGSKSESNSRSKGGSESKSEGEAKTDGWSMRDDDLGTEQGSTSSNHSATEGKNWSEGEEFGKSFSAGKSESRSRGGDRGISRNRGMGFNESISVTENESVTDSENIGIAHGTNHTVHHKKTFLPVHEDIREETGRLRISVQDQLAFVKSLITRLGCREFLIRVGSGRTQFVRVDEIELAFEGFPKLLEFHKNKLEQEIRSYHPFYFEAGKCTGKNNGSVYAVSSEGTPPRPTSGLGLDSTGAKRLLDELQRNSHRNNGAGSSSSAESN